MVVLCSYFDKKNGIQVKHINLKTFSKEIVRETVAVGLVFNRYIKLFVLFVLALML